MIRKYSEDELKKIYLKITGTDLAPSELVPILQPIFHKTYKAPGYPVEPRNEVARARKGIVGRVLDLRQCKNYLNQSVN